MSNQKKTALYCRLSQDDGLDGDSNSIQNQVRIEYDPYHTQIFYNWRTDSEREWGQLTNSILTEQEIYQKSSLQSILPEVIARIDENYNRNKCEPLETVFRGTDEDYEDFEEILATYYSNLSETIRAKGKEQL